MPAKNAKNAKPVRKCRRCGCTEARACLGGCAWVLNTDVCDRCLTNEECALGMLIEELRGIADRLMLSTQRAENLLQLKLKNTAPSSKRKGRR
jgi:hypothetical protein